MPISPVNRRTVLQTGAATAGGLALGSLLQPAEAAGGKAQAVAGAVAGAAAGAAAGPALVSGMLAGWVIVDLHRSAAIRFAHIAPGAPPLELGEPVQVSLRRWSGLSYLDQMNHATSAAHGLARARLARAWGVARRDCILECRRIRDRGSDRAIGYSLWVDLA